MGKLAALLQLASRRVDHGNRARDQPSLTRAAAIETALHVRAGVDRDGAATFIGRDVEVAGLAAVGRRPEVSAAGDGRADLARRLVREYLGAEGVGLHILARIVVDRFTGLRIDAFGPVYDLDVLRRLQELAVEAIEHVVEAVAAGMREQLAVLAVDLGVDEDVSAGLVVVHVVVRRVLVPPRDLAVRRVEGDRAIGEEIVAGTISRIVGGNRIARAPIRQVGDRIIGAGAVERPASGEIGVVLVLPGLAAGLARRGDRVGLPLELAGLGVERGDPVAQPAVAAGAAHDDRILQRQRRR